MNIQTAQQRIEATIGQLIIANNTQAATIDLLQAELATTKAALERATNPVIPGSPDHKPPPAAAEADV